jgi:hypothetical protein
MMIRFQISLSILTCAATTREYWEWLEKTPAEKLEEKNE